MAKRMRILLTGGTGFIGRALGTELARRGHELVCLVRDPSRASLPYPAELVPWQGEVPALRDIDAVIHLAGESIGGKRRSKAQKTKIIESRVATAKALGEGICRAAGHRPRAFISAAAIGYYGDRGDEVLNEESTPGEGFLAETCLAWEAAASEAGEGLRVVCVRTGLVLGREGGALAAMLPLFKAGLGGRLGSGRQWMSWIHLDDLVQLYCFALENEAVSGPVNGVAPHPVTNAEFTKSLGTQLKVPAFLPAPAFALKLALGEMSALLLESQRVRSRATELGFRFRYERVGEALAAVFKHVERARGPFFHEHISRIWLPYAPEEVFAQLTDPAMLAPLTPPAYALEVENHSTVILRENSTVDYSVGALGRRAEVRSLIFDFVENHRYSTTHQKGPFTFWRHARNLERLAGGTLLTDRVIYRCPGGLLGSLLGARWVENHLREIFAYRNRKLGDLGAALPSARPAV